MARKNKLARFAENLTFRHMLQPSYGEACEGRFPLRGAWGQEFFGNSHPITLEVGCGRGEYTVSLAARNPGGNFIGVDIKGARMWYGARRVALEGMGNVAFLRARIETLDLLFGPGEVSEIWITFPDPQLKDSRASKRLTSGGFLGVYWRILKAGGRMHLKTDSRELYDYTLSTLEEYGVLVDAQSTDIDEHPPHPELLAVRTRYEEMFRAQGKAICYVSFRFPEGFKEEDLPAVSRRPVVGVNGNDGKREV